MKKQVGPILSFAVAVAILMSSGCSTTKKTGPSNTSSAESAGVSENVSSENSLTSSSGSSASSNSVSTLQGSQAAIRSASTASLQIGVSKPAGTQANLSTNGWSYTNPTQAQLRTLYPKRPNIKGTVNVFIPIPSDDPWYVKAIGAKKEFEADYPNAKVNIVPAQWSTKDTKLRLLVNSGQSPDWVMSQYTDFPRYAIQKLVQPIDSLIISNPRNFTYMMDNVTVWKGKRYAMVSGSPNYNVIFYNKNMFANKSVKTPLQYYNDGTWDLNKLKYVAQQMSDAKNGIYGFATDYDEMFPLAYGADFISFKAGSPIINVENANFKTGLKFFDDMINIDKSVEPMHWDTLLQKWFCANKVAMIYTPASDYILMKSYGMASSKYDIVPFPKLTGSNKYLSIAQGVDCWSIAYGSHNPAGGMAFGEAMQNYEIKDPTSNENTQPWTAAQQQRLNAMTPVISLWDGYNLNHVNGSNDNGTYNDLINECRAGGDVNTVVEKYKGQFQNDLNLLLSGN